jgi:hypothetical protein
LLTAIPSIKVSGEIEAQLRHIRGDAGDEPPRWIAAADGSMIQAPHIVRVVVRDDDGPLVA